MTLTRRQEAATLYVVGFTHAEIAAALGLTMGGARSTVTNARRAYNLQARNRMWCDYEESLVMALAAKGWTKREIAAELGMRWDQVRGVVYRGNKRAAALATAPAE